jgi:hypothetical protein
MSQRFHLLSLPFEYEKAIPHVLGALNDAGLQTVLSFDLKVARSTHADCECPNHGTKQCDCQMAVFIVYGNGYSPATIVAHSRDGRSQFQLVDSPGQRPDAAFEADIRQALAHIKMLRPPSEREHNAQ